MVYAFDDYTGYNVIVEGRVIGKIVQESGIKKTDSWADPIRDLTVKLHRGYKITVRTDELEDPGFFRRIYDFLLKEKSLVLITQENKKENPSRNLTDVLPFRNTNSDGANDLDTYYR